LIGRIDEHLAVCYGTRADAAVTLRLLKPALFGRSRGRDRALLTETLKALTVAVPPASEQF